jgi:GNAT superfamily N-acetyltransferase
MALKILYARTPARIETARGLFREYEQGLGVSLCFQRFEEEVAGLPGAYAPPTGALLIAVADGAPVGCVALRRLGDGACEMKRLFVRPERRGRGVGRALAGAAIEEARRLGYRVMRLDTLQRLNEATALYDSLGFQRIPPYNDAPLPDIIYWELVL